MQINVAQYHACVTCINTLRNDNLTPMILCVANTIGGYSNTYNTYNSAVSTYGSVITPACIGLFMSTPWCCCYWPYVPSLGGVSGSICVCNADGTSGNSCTWTVPAGVTMARFQIWGAGTPSAGSACCGGSKFGGTGAYASVMMPVTEGCQYVICAGGTTSACSYYDYSVDISTFAGCSSYVTGYGLCNFCAEGGEPSTICMMRTMDVSGCLQSWNSCMFVDPPHVTMSCLGYCGHFIMCNGSTICQGSGYAGSVDQATYVPMIRSCKTYYGNTHSSFCDSCWSYRVYGMPGMFGCMRFNLNNYMCAWQPPVFGFLAGCQWSTTTGTCGGSLCNAALTSIPSAGGWATHAMGGNFICGGPGRAGMVCVQYC